MTVACIDFETDAIKPRPEYLPRPVGVSLKFDNEPSRYFAWGHDSGNNCDAVPMAELERACSADHTVMHNAKFDLEILHKLGIARVRNLDDTMIMAFLHDPCASSYGLKQLADRWLNLPAGERDDLAAWWKTNTGRTDYAANMPRMPGDIVGAYAVGDTDRTFWLWEALSGKIYNTSMARAYADAIALIPILIRMEQRGVRLDREEVDKQLEWLCEYIGDVDTAIRGRIGRGVNLNSAAEVMSALDRQGLLDRTKTRNTAGGKMLSTTEEDLAVCVTDQKVLGYILGYRQAVRIKSDFHDKWEGKSRIYPTWHQTRGSGGWGKNYGAKTGRLISTDPTVQNIPNYSPRVLPGLPSPRGCIVAEDGHVFVGRDYSQQEPRILAHYVEGALLEMYKKNPRINFHHAVAEQLNATGLRVSKEQAKAVNLGLIYGMGVAKLAVQAGTDVATAKQLKDAVLQQYPGIADLYGSMRMRETLGQCLTTWGGRQYYAEPGYGYKMVNTLIQGSAADCTKRAILNYGPVTLALHDELVVSVPEDRVAEESERLREAMESVEFDVPMLTEEMIARSYCDV